MRGRPLLQWTLFSLFWLGLLLPMLRVTGRATIQQEPPSAADSNASTATVWLRWTFSEAPDSATLSWEGKPCWNITNTTEVVLEKRQEVPWPADGPELLVHVTWPAPAHRAMELVVEPVDGEPRSITRWTDGAFLQERIVLAP